MICQFVIFNGGSFLECIAISWKIERVSRRCSTVHIFPLYFQLKYGSSSWSFYPEASTWDRWTLWRNITSFIWNQGNNLISPFSSMIRCSSIVGSSNHSKTEFKNAWNTPYIFCELEQSLICRINVVSKKFVCVIIPVM